MPSFMPGSKLIAILSQRARLVTFLSAVRTLASDEAR